jgi:hypothetical protein
MAQREPGFVIGFTFDAVDLPDLKEPILIHLGKGNSMRGRNARKAIQLVAKYQAELAKRWEEIHGATL